MTDQNPPSPPVRAPGRFKTVVAWVCGPIVLLELIALAAATIWGASVMHSAESSKTYISMARLLVGGMEVNPKLGNGEPMPDSFFGTCAELMMNAALQKRATYRVRALHPDLAPRLVKIEAARMPGTRILVIRATAEDPAYAMAMLDAVMDEFIAVQKEMTGTTSEEKTVAIQDELVRLEKDMQHTEERQRAAQQSGASAEEVDKLKSQLERAQRSHDKLTDMLREIDRQPRVGKLFTILEHASLAIRVVPSFSIFNLFK